MKKSTCLLLILMLLLSGCFPGNTQEDIPMQTTGSIAAPDAPAVLQQDMVAVCLPVAEEEFSDANGKLLFTFRSQTMQLVLPDPDVGQKIIQDFSARQADFRTASEVTKALAEEYSAQSPLFYHALYAPGRMDMNVLSLGGTIVNWAGGMHPDISCIFANYDMVTGDMLTLGSILVHENKAEALGELVIRAIASEKERQGIWDGFEPQIQSPFRGSISEDQSWFFTADGIAFSFPPYELAPYASGIVTVTVPYDRLVGIIDDAYFPVELAETDGQLRIVSLQEAELSQFDQIAEIIADESGHMVFLYTDTAVGQVTIRTEQGHTIFATPMLTPGDAIMLEADFTKQAPVVEYMTDGKLQSRYILLSEGDARLVEQLPQ